MANQTTGFSAKLEADIGTESAFVALGDYVSIKFGDTSVNMVEVQPLDQITKTYIAGSITNAPVTAEIYYTKADLTAVYGMLRVQHNFKVTFPDDDGAGDDVAQTATFAGLVSKVSLPELKHDGTNMITVEIQPCGAMTLGSVS